LAEDIAAAKAEGKRLAIVFEQRGCIYCAKMHEVILADPEVADYIKANFKVVQYNMFGDEEVIDLDGEKLSEKTAARKWGYVFTPTIVFLPEDVPQGKTVAQAAVATMPGAFGKWTFLNMFKWVRERGYEGDEHFQKYHARIINELRATGRLDAE
jgi:thioredoxin-related protein